jgi:hypothetical protein
MIPFLKKRDEASASAPAGKIERRPDEDKEEDYDGLEACMSELAAALKSDDPKAAAVAFRSAFDMLEMQPHEEGPHE